MRSCAFYRRGALPAKRVSVRKRADTLVCSCVRLCAHDRRTLPPLCVRLRTFAISLNPQTTSVRVGAIWIRYRRVVRARLITRCFTISIRSAFGCISIHLTRFVIAKYLSEFFAMSLSIIFAIIYTSEISLSWNVKFDRKYIHFFVFFSKFFPFLKVLIFYCDMYVPFCS